MKQLDYAGALAYLVQLGQRHSLIKDSYSGSFDQDPEGSAKWPLLFVEEEPYLEQINPGADLFSFAFQVLTKPERPGAVPSRDLLQLTKEIADQLLEQIRRDQVVGLVGNASAVALAGSASDSLATGWRYEIKIQAANKINRTTNPDLFAPLS